MKSLRLALLPLVALAVGSASAQEKPEREAAERVEATSTVVPCKMESISQIAASLSSRPVIAMPCPATQGVCLPEDDTMYIRGCGSVYVDGIMVTEDLCKEQSEPVSYEPVFETERSRTGITARRIGYPESEPADE